MLPFKARFWVGLGFLGLAAALCAGSLPSRVAREPAPRLPGVPHEIRSGEEHEYSLPLAPGDVVAAAVLQQGIDVSLILLGPDRKPLISMDSPQGTRGTERLVAVPPGGGMCWLLVRAAEGWSSGGRGRYVLRIEEPRPAGPRDLLQARAFRELFQGEELRRKGTAADRRQALVHYDTALRLWQELEDADQQVLVLYRRGKVLRDLGAQSAAVDAYRQARSLARDPEFRLYILNHLAVLHARLGDVRQALQVGREAEDLAMRIDNLASRAAALSNLGMVHRTWGEYNEALSYFTRSLEVWKKVGPHPERATTLSNRAELLISLGHPRLALEPLRESLEVLADLGEPGRQGHTYRLLGMAYDRLGSTPLALFHLEKARERARSIGDLWVETQALNDTGSALLKTGLRREAHAMFSEAARISRAGELLESEAYALAGLGLIALEQGDEEGALGFLARSEEIYGALGSNPLSVVLYRRAMAERNQGRIEEALETIRRALSLVEALREDVSQSDLRIHIIGARTDFYDLEVDLLLRLHERSPRRGYEAQAFAASERRRARSQLEMVLKTGTGPPRLPPDIRQRQGVLRNRLQELVTERLQIEAGAPGTGRHRDLVTLEAEAREATLAWEALVEEIRRRSPGYAAVAEPNLVDVAEVQDLLEPDTALIAYTVGEERSVLWWIDKESLEVHPDLPRRAALERLAKDAYDLLSKAPSTKQRSREQNLLKELGETLLQPVAERLPRVRRLVVVADGALQTLPFAALSRPGSTEPLVATHAVVHLPSASLAAALRARQQGRPVPPEVIAVFADPVFGPSDERVRQAPRSEIVDLPRLPHSLSEAEAILEMAPPDKSLRRVGFDANFDAAMNPTLERYRYIHFATHGLVNLENPSLSGIQLSKLEPDGEVWDGEGILPFYEVYNLRLPADLVTLSACRTAAGPHVRGEGPLGMSRSFLYAGASRVVGALWDVDDAAAARLMVHFYRALLQEGQPPALALQDAQNAMRADTSAPHHWAGFVLQGDWR